MAINKVITNERNGVQTTYHRIVGISGNYDHGDGQLTVQLESYLSEERRNDEKEQIAEIESQITRYYELTEKAQQDVVNLLIEGEPASALTQEEQAELDCLDIQELEAKKIEKKEFETVTYTIPFTEELRDGIYEYLDANVSSFQGGTMI